MEEAP